MVTAVLLAVVGVFAPRAEAQPEPPPRDGTATYKDLTGPGACSFPSQPADRLHVGVSTEEFAGAAACGSYLDVTGPAGVVQVQVTDHCNRCPAGLVDLSRPAFERIGDVGAGRVPAHYEPVRNPPLAAPISVQVKDGSTTSWAQFQILDHGNRLASVELAHPHGGWRPLPRSADNFWTAANPGPGAGPHQFRITDIYGQTATVAGVTLTPVVQPSEARLYPPPAAPPPATTAPPTTAPGTTSSMTVTVGDDVFDPTPTPPDETAAEEATRRQPSRPRRGSDRGADTVLPIFVVLAGMVVLVRIAAWYRRRRRAASPNLPRLWS